MKGDPKEVVGRFWDAVNERDLSRLLELCDEQIELDSALGSTHHGHDGVKSWWQDLFEVAGRYEGTIEDSLALDDLILALVRVDATGQTSGMEGARHVLQVFNVRQGKVNRLAVHLDPADALEDAARQLR